MKVAIPILNNQISPCFDSAKKFEITTIEKSVVNDTQFVSCSTMGGVIRVRLLRLYEVQTLICNGIKNFYRNNLSAFGISVIPNVSKQKDEAINDFINGKLKFTDSRNSLSEYNKYVSHDGLVETARALFENNGYSVSTNCIEDSCLIDLVAKISCPVCGKNINVAICCGAQTYRPDQEIREFYHISKAQYDSRVYVYLNNPQIEKKCREYGIDLLSPGSSESIKSKTGKSLLPLLSNPIEGHEKAFYAYE